MDFCPFPIMRESVPVFEAHSLPFLADWESNCGQSQYIGNFARAGVACGVDAVFMEVHDNPAS
jgi:2-dehydro-3-deoxyphosphooctonate aldolase (KDO 8-P synthase)